MDQAVLEAARAIRPFLVDLVGPNLAPEVDTKLAGLLARVEGGEDVEGGLRATLKSYEATSVFLDRVRRDAPRFRPPWVVSELTRRSYNDLPGESAPVAAEKYRCPHGDYVWYLMEVGATVPQCPTHHGKLEPV